MNKNQNERANPRPLKPLYVAVNVLMNFGKRQYQYVHGSHLIYAQILPKMSGSRIYAAQ